MSEFKGRKHSPLPWRSEHGYIFDANGGMVADYDELDRDHPEATVRARGVGRGLTDAQQDENMADICEAMNNRARLAAENEALKKELEQARKEIAEWEESFDTMTSEGLRVATGLRNELAQARQRIARLDSDLIHREGEVERLEREAARREGRS